MSAFLSPIQIEFILSSTPFMNVTLIWVGFLGVRFDVKKGLGWEGGGGGKITPFLNLVRIMLETSNLARKYTDICSLRKYTFQYFFF